MSASMLIEALADHRRRGFEESRQERHTSFNSPFRAHTDLHSGHRDRYSLMLRNRIYYGLKPFVPQSIRTATPGPAHNLSLLGPESEWRLDQASTISQQIFFQRLR